jgi:hypothetical protein
MPSCSWGTSTTPSASHRQWRTGTDRRRAGKPRGRRGAGHRSDRQVPGWWVYPRASALRTTIGPSMAAAAAAITSASACMSPRAAGSSPLLVRATVCTSRPNTVYLRAQMMGWRCIFGAWRWWGCLRRKPDILRLTTRGLARERRSGSNSYRISAVTHISASSIVSGGKTRVAGGRSASGPE